MYNNLSMIATGKTAYVLLGALGTFSIFSYILFQTYEPKVLKQLQEVRGIKSDASSFLPYPQDAREIGMSKTKNGRQITLETTKSPQEVQTFYKNVLIAKGWKVESRGVSGTFESTIYKKKNEKIVISTSKQGNSEYSFLSIDIRF